MSLSKLSILILFITSSGLAKASTAETDTTIENEEAIQFTTKDGESTAAFSGHFYVPENRERIDGRMIRINYVRFPTTSKTPGHPIVYLSGGPGGSGIGTAKRQRFPMFMALREQADVIALDQRDTGQSERPERCISSERMALTDPTSYEDMQSQYKNAATACLSWWQEQGIDVYGYTTAQSALDISDLRRHIDAKKVSLWGISYGSHLAFAAMKLLPNEIDKVVIASAEGLNQTVKLPAQTDKYFSRVQKVIDQQPLHQRVPDLKKLIERVHRKLDESPITVQVGRERKSDMLFQRLHMQGIASRMIADPNQNLAILIQIYSELDEGQTRSLEELLKHNIFRDEPIAFNLMPLAMDVASGITQDRLDKVDQQAKDSLLGYMLNHPMPMLTNIDPKLDLGDQFRTAPKSDIPTLLFTGTLDGRTYPDEQLRAVRNLSNLTQVTIQHAGHNLYMSSPEVSRRTQDFLSNRDVETTDIQLPLPNLSLGR